VHTIKKAVSYRGESSTVGDNVLFECKEFSFDCSLMLRTRNYNRWRYYEVISSLIEKTGF